MGLKNYPLYLAIPFLLVNIIFILGISFGIPLNDEWRWIKELLVPLLNGEISFQRYMLGEYSLLSHSHFLALLFLWIDYYLFDLDFTYFSYVGLIFYVLGYVLILGYVKQFLQGDAWVDLPAVLILSIGYFCITSDFAWLLVMFEYVYFFLAIGLLIVLDLFFRQRASFVLLLLATFLCLLLGDTIGMAAVFVCVAALLAYSVIQFSKIKYFAILLFSLACFFMLQYWVLGKGVPLGEHSRFDTLSAMLNAPADVLISFMSIFSQPLVDITIFRFLVGEKTAPILQFGLGVLGFVFICSIVMAYFYARGWKKSWLPILFIAYGCLCWLLIFVSRYLYFGVAVMDEPRYVRLLTLIYVGGGIALLCIHLHPLARRIYACAAAIMFMGYLGTLSFKFWQDQYVESYFASAKLELQKGEIDSAALSNYISRCAKDYCIDTVEFMKKNQLSIFKNPDASEN
ncbi:MAG: hypothetical protein Q7T48_15610 [Cellvibrio sp.]|uniref:hypothetical protein n=1 Tax=Cellvibrio sp. TaxID=1965322 RepID=UPI00271A1B59|nr:hypothetical protein [Cellvibrio sp.]